MGSTRSFLLILALGSAGCGRLGFGENDDPANDEGGTNLTVGVVDASARAPAICEAVTDLATAATSDVDLAVASTPTGATAMWIPTGAGGDLVGVDIGTNRTAGPLTTVQSGPFTASSAAFIDGKLVAGVISSSRALIESVPQPLAAAAEIGNFDGMFVGKTTMLHSNADRVTATSCSSGLTMNAFDTAWNGAAATFSVTTNATLNIDTTPIGAQAFAVWSTTGDCHYETVTSRTTGTTRQTLTKACLNARLGSAGNQVAMVFEEGTKSGLVIDDFTTVSVTNALYIAGARSPRVIHDGTRFWITYLDATNHVVIGYVDDYGMVLTSQLPDAAPADKAYELAMLDGQPWLFEVGKTTKRLNASRLCVPAY